MTTSIEVLHTLANKSSSGWNDNRLLALIAAHQHADHAVLTRVLDQVGALLALPDLPL
jgi:hypothetical protein